MLGFRKVEMRAVFLIRLPLPLAQPVRQYGEWGMNVILVWCWAQWPKLLNAPLSQVDPELEDIIEHEKNRQWKVLFLPTPLRCLPLLLVRNSV